METTHDDISMVFITNIISPRDSGCCGAVQPPTTVPETNDITEALGNEKKNINFRIEEEY